MLLNSNTYSVTKCPLCSSKKKKFHSFSEKNLYSELLAKLFKKKEDLLLKKIFNLKCTKCNLIYKNKWFEQKVLNNLFNKIQPYHPKGRDVYSNIFKKSFFFNLLNDFYDYYRSKDQVNYNKTKRTIISIINAIPKNNLIKKNFLSLINKKKINLKKINKIGKSIGSKIRYPERFSRFLGYGDDKLWKFLKERSGKINTYAEIGCPSWGFLKKAKKEKKNVYFINKYEKNFWGKKCYFQNKGCLKNCNLKKNQILHFSNLIKVNLIGIIEYFDHIENPLNFINKISNNADNYFIITEDFSKTSIKIQHFTGWNHSCLRFLAKKTGKQLFYKKKIAKNINVSLAFFKKFTSDNLKTTQ